MTKKLTAADRKAQRDATHRDYVDLVLETERGLIFLAPPAVCPCGCGCTPKTASYRL